jgi:hypothetical protein
VSEEEEAPSVSKEEEEELPVGVEEEEEPSPTSPPSHPSWRREEVRCSGDGCSFSPRAYAREEERCDGG